MGNKNIRDGRGRPVYGAQRKSVERKVRLEPYVDDQVVYMARVLGISVSDVIRNGIRMYIQWFSKNMQS